MGLPCVCYTEARRAWMRLWEDLKGERYYWTGKDSAHLKQLLAKIRAKMAEMPSPTPATDADTVTNMELFCRKAAKADSWVADNLSVAIINSKFNELYTKIKNGKSATNNKPDSSYLQGIIADLNA